MVDPGSINRIWGQAFVAGVLPIKVRNLFTVYSVNRIRRIYQRISISNKFSLRVSCCVTQTGCGLQIALVF